MQVFQRNVGRGFAGLGFRLCALIVVGLGLGGGGGGGAAFGQTDTEHLLEGVGRIGSPGVPGPVLVIGEDAFGVVTPREDQAVVAAARAGRGRIVVFGHGGFLGEEKFDTTMLVANAVAWAGDGERALSVFGLPGHIALELERRGIRVTRIEGSAAEAIGLADVIVLDSHQFTDELSPKLGVYLRRGGGLVTAGLGWGWLQLNPGRTILDHPGNKLLAEFGLAFGTGTLNGSDGGFDVSPEPARWVNAAFALEALAGGEELDAANATSAARSVSTALSQYPGAEKLSRRLRGIVRNRTTELAERYKTMSTNGLTYEDDAMARLSIDLFMVDEFDIPAERVRAHASADGFPGAVGRGERDVVERVTVDTSVRGWHSTGLYAAAGDRITVICPDEAVGRGFVVQIGSHLDPESRGALNRLPRVVRRFVLQEKVNRAANAVGGLVYIDVPREIAGAGGLGGDGGLEFEIRGAVRAPVFFSGATDESAWRDEIRHRQVPWGELVGDDVVLTLPVEVLVDLENPAALIAFWDKAVEAAGSLQPRRLTGMGDRPVRLVPDVSVSWGYMYAPHDSPLTFPMHSAAVMTDLEVLSGQKHGDVWGLFHELGHFHQDPMWTFGGTGEVTVNLFTLYVLDKVCGIASADERETFEPEKILEAMREHHEAGAPFDVWKSKPFLALLMYVQIQQAFGWEAYEEVFGEYRGLAASGRPKDDDQKRDQWLVRLSRTVGRDLGPFFEAWGVPTSEAARQSISHLARWMPEGWLDEPLDSLGDGTGG